VSTDDRADMAIPLGVGQAATGANTSTMRVSSRDRRFLSVVWILSSGCGCVAQLGDSVMQGRLVGFALSDQMNTTGSGMLECFF
jgi:hypothetical protein